MEYELEDDTKGDQQDQDLSTETRLAFTKNNPHAKFVHFNTVTPIKTLTPTKAVKFNQRSPMNDNLFKFSLDEPKDKSNNQHDNNSIITDTSRYFCAPESYTIDKSKYVDIPNDEDSYDTARLDQILHHNHKTGELDK